MSGSPHTPDPSGVEVQDLLAVAVEETIENKY